MSRQPRSSRTAPAEGLSAVTEGHLHHRQEIAAPTVPKIMTEPASAARGGLRWPRETATRIDHDHGGTARAPHADQRLIRMRARRAGAVAGPNPAGQGGPP